MLLFLCQLQCHRDRLFFWFVGSAPKFGRRSGRILIYLARQFTARRQILIDMLCHPHKAGVLSSRVRGVLCSWCYLSCSLERSPGALLSPPHIKDSLISATLIATHPVIINLRLMYMHLNLSLFSGHACMRPCGHAHTCRTHTHTHTYIHVHTEIPLAQMKEEVPGD